MTNSIIIQGWECSIDSETKERCARFKLDSRVRSVIYYKPGKGLIWDYINDNIPEKVLDFLLKPTYYFIWEEGGDWREKWGSDNWQEHNPYKE